MGDPSTSYAGRAGREKKEGEYNYFGNQSKVTILNGGERTKGRAF